jgi:hypothetical protein
LAQAASSRRPRWRFAYARGGLPGGHDHPAHAGGGSLTLAEAAQRCVDAASGGEGSVGFTWCGAADPGPGAAVPAWVKTAACPHREPLGGGSDSGEEGWHTLLLLREDGNGLHGGADSDADDDGDEGNEEDDVYVRNSTTSHAGRLGDGAALMLIVGER